MDRGATAIRINKGGTSVLIHIDGNQWYYQSGTIVTNADEYTQNHFAYNWGNGFYGNYYVYGGDDDLTDRFDYIDSNGYKLLVKKEKSE